MTLKKETIYLSPRFIGWMKFCNLFQYFCAYYIKNKIAFFMFEIADALLIMHFYYFYSFLQV